MRKEERTVPAFLVEWSRQLKIILIINVYTYSISSSMLHAYFKIPYELPHLHVIPRGHIQLLLPSL